VRISGGLVARALPSLVATLALAACGGIPVHAVTVPRTTQPRTTQPGTTQPGTTQPRTTQPRTTQPGTTQPGVTRARGAVASSAPSPTRTPPCQVAPGFSCIMQKRITEVQNYLAGSPGEIGIVLRDRQDGAVWRDSDAGTEFPAASTIKLAMIVDLLLRNQSGQIELSDDDWDQIDQILNESSDTAADQLWSEYFDRSFLDRIAGYGMPDAEFSQDPPYWGYMYCTADDLDGLIGYVLDKLPASMRDFIVSRLRHVASDQQFGVWGAGSHAEPGNKDGWEDDSGVWIIDSVGFAGSGARYTLSMMYDLEGNGTFSDGANTLTQIAALLFRGRQTAAPTIEATP
jgi:hypothetical protein